MLLKSISSSREKEVTLYKKRENTLLKGVKNNSKTKANKAIVVDLNNARRDPIARSRERRSITTGKQLHHATLAPHLKFILLICTVDADKSDSLALQILLIQYLQKYNANQKSIQSPVTRLITVINFGLSYITTPFQSSD